MTAHGLGIAATVRGVGKAAAHEDSPLEGKRRFCCLNSQCNSWFESLKTLESFRKKLEISMKKSSINCPQQSQDYALLVATAWRRQKSKSNEEVALRNALERKEARKEPYGDKNITHKSFAPFASRGARVQYGSSRRRQLTWKSKLN